VPRHGDLLGRRLQAARDRAFVGRSEQLGLFRAALDGDPASPAVFYLHDPGGIGKSMLLRRFAAEAEADGRVVVEVDGRMVEPIPSAVETEAAPSLVDDRAVLLIDTFERCQGLEGWLRDRFLPRLPVGVLVVVAGREPPDPRWTSDPGWAVLLYVAALRNLVPDDAIALLDAHGVPAVMHNPVLAFTGGNPLALTLAAAVARRDEGAAATWRPTRDVVETLLAQLISDVPSPRHRQALEVCAHAYVTTETLLRAVLGDDAGAEFAWLRTLPFVESTGRGLFPHDVVRESLDADLRWRDPDGYEAMHRTIHGHLFQGVRNAPESGILAAVGAFLYMYRTDGHMAEFHGWRGEGEVQEAAYEPTDHADVLRLAAEAEGDASALVAAYWLDRQPEAFRIYRATQTGETVAFSAWLRLTGATGEDADPVVVATAWSHARSMAPLHLGEHIAVARFSVHPAHYQRRSPVMDLIQWRAMGEIFRADHLAWSYILMRDGEFWGPHMVHFDMLPIPPRPTVGEHGYTLFAHDWRAQPVVPWLDQKTRAMFAGPQVRHPPHTGPRGSSLRHRHLAGHRRRTSAGDHAHQRRPHAPR